jgi:hypothetical protein
MSSKGKISPIKMAKESLSLKTTNALAHIEYGMRIYSCHNVKTYAK